MKRILVFGVDPFHPATAREITREVFFNRYGGNTGNLLFGRAVAQYLKRSDNVMTYGLYDLFTSSFAEKVNDEFDHIILPLANHIGPHLSDELSAITKLVKSSKIPVTVIGIGAQSTYDYEFDFLKGSENVVKEFFQAVLEKSESVGIRGEFTAEVLKRLGFKDRIRVIGCPSLYMGGKDFRLYFRGEFESPRTVFNYSPKAANVFKALAKSLSSPVSYVTQYLPDSSSIDAATLEVLSTGNLHLFGDFDTWANFQASHDFTISSRIHGSLLSIAAGTPAFLLADDSRTRELGEFLSIPYANPNSLSEACTVTELLQRCDLSEFNKTYSNKFNSFVSFLEENNLEHNLLKPDAGRGVVPCVPFDDSTTIQLDDRSLINGLLVRLERSQQEIDRLKQELSRRTELNAIVKQSLGAKLGSKRVKAIKKIFRLQ